MSSQSCLHRRPKNFIQSTRNRLYHIAQPEYATHRMPNPPVRHDCELMEPEKSTEDVMREEIKAFQKGEINARRAGESALVGTKMEKDLEMFHQSLGFTPPKVPQTRADQIYPLRVTLESDPLEEERKDKDLKTLLERRAAKTKMDCEANMRPHSNLNGIYAGVGSGEGNQQADERLRAHEEWGRVHGRWGVARFLGANIDTHEEEANIPQIERFDVARPPSSRSIPCNHVKPFNHTWPGYMSNGYLDFRGFSPEFAEGDKRRQMEVAKGDGEMGEESKNEVKKQMVKELTDNNREIDSKSGELKREVIKEGEAKRKKEEAKEDKLSKKAKESLQPEKLGVRHENELKEEDTDEVGVERAGEDTRDYIHVVNILMECDGYRRTNEQLPFLDHRSQQTPHPHNLKSKWIIVNDFVEDGEEFVFVEKDA